MALYAIADLHLTGKSGESKSMAVFDEKWLNAKEKLKRNWKALITDDDYVVLPGDFSWAMTLEEAYPDFDFLNSLPGTKILGKGNHDFWWCTAKKMNDFFVTNHFDSIKLLYNNSFEIPGFNICGTRGWFPDPMNQKTVGETDWNKMNDRENLRLRHSLSSVLPGSNSETIVFLHFPPVWNGFVCRNLIDTMHEYKITKCYFGHIHGVYGSLGDFEFEGINCKMISADHLDFIPQKVY